jgi:uncharacterized protein (UPF0147 family)
VAAVTVDLAKVVGMADTVVDKTAVAALVRVAADKAAAKVDNEGVPVVKAAGVIEAETATTNRRAISSKKWFSSIDAPRS